MPGFRGRSEILPAVLAVVLVAVMAASVGAQGMATSTPAGGVGKASAWRLPAGTGAGPVMFYAGWGADVRGTKLSFDIQRTDTEDLFALHQNYPVRGLWLGLAAQGRVKYRWGILGHGWVLVPSSATSDESISIQGTLPASKNWRARTDWWFADGALATDHGRGRFLAGFRFDRFATNFEEPESFSGIVGLPSDRSDVTINSYIPFLGYQLLQDSPRVSRLKLSIIGFPWFLSDMKYHDTVGGLTVLLQDRIEMKKLARGKYFLEVQAEYQRNIRSLGAIGLFARWNALHAETNRISISDVLQGTPLSGEYQFGVNRQSWTLGASFSMAFTTPLSIR
ncbi:MAG: hypothetical protein AB1646_22625 [Thermodesulfobacteriota bacterium]